MQGREAYIGEGEVVENQERGEGAGLGHGSRRKGKEGSAQ